jgi:translation initiation factor IF-3
VRLIDQNEIMIGVVSKDEAIKLAQEAGYDLVEVSPNSDPPVCRILDFGKYRYEQGKKERANRAKAKVVETKEVRLGRSMKIDPHDVQIRINQARKFLFDGHKVLIVQNFRGREMMHKERGNERMKEIIEKLSDISKVETSPRFAGRRQTMVLAPDKTKIQSVLATQAAEQEKEQATDEQNKEV